jgi:N-hydroxyarylamine O-acetyltransferase
LETLRGLHKKHLLSVPFENLDIHLGRPIVLSEEAFYEKIIRDHRGGFCYELNGSFAALLTRLGFKVTMLSARVASRSGGFSPEFDHMTLLVAFKGRWLVDVGFGDSFTEPKRLDYSGLQSDNGRVYRSLADLEGDCCCDGTLRRGSGSLNTCSVCDRGS